MNKQLINYTRFECSFQLTQYKKSITLAKCISNVSERSIALGTLICNSVICMQKMNTSWEDVNKLTTEGLEVKTTLETSEDVNYTRNE